MDEDYCLQVAKKWIKAHGGIETINDKAKLTRHLLSKGFLYEEVNSVVKKITNIESENDWN